MTFVAFSAGIRPAGLGAIALIAAMTAAAPAQAQADGIFTGFKGEILTGLDDDGVDYDDDFFDGGKTAQTGWLYGFGIGYDYQMGSAVLGVEAELMESTAGKQRSYTGNRVNPLLIPPTTPVTLNSNIDAGGDIYIGVRGGFLVTPQALVYAKLGWSMHKIDIDGSGVDGGVPFAFEEKIDVDGFRLGIGGEYAFNSSFFGKVEYRYTNYNNGDLDVRGANVNLDPLFEGIDVVRHQFVLGLGFRF
jgi:outer membrane immunogenic protein